MYTEIPSYLVSSTFTKTYRIEETARPEPISVPYVLALLVWFRKFASWAIRCFSSGKSEKICPISCWSIAKPTTSTRLRAALKIWAKNPSNMMPRRIPHGSHGGCALLGLALRHGLEQVKRAWPKRTASPIRPPACREAAKRPSTARFCERRGQPRPFQLSKDPPRVQGLWQGRQD